MFFSPSAAAWLFRIIFFSSAARPTSFLTSFLLCLAFIQHAHSLSRETWFFHTLRLDSTRLYIYDVSNNVRLLGTFHCETSTAYFPYFLPVWFNFPALNTELSTCFPAFPSHSIELGTLVSISLHFELSRVCWTLGRNRENSLTFPIELNYLQCETQSTLHNIHSLFLRSSLFWPFSFCLLHFSSALDSDFN